MNGTRPETLRGRPLKVLHVIPSLSPARGGPTIVMRQLMTSLSRHGATVIVAATDDDGPGRRLPVPLGVPLPDSGATCWYFPRQTGFYSFSWPLTRWLRRRIPTCDVVHIHALFSYPSAAAAWIARRAGVPYVLRPLGTLAPWGLSSHRPFLKRLSLALVEKPLLRSAALVQATSEQERGEILAACPACRAVVIPNPVEAPSELPARPSRPEPEVILFLSRIDPKKGLEVLLRAFSQVASAAPRLRLVVAGNGEPGYVASVRRLAASLGAHDRISFEGAVGRERKTQLMAEADLFVLPSRSENFGVAVAEAMAHGLPVLISTDVGIHREVTAAAAGRTAPCAPEPLAEALREMLANPAGLADMGANGRRLARELYSPEAVARRLLDCYENLIGGGAPADKNLEGGAVA